MSLQGSIKFNLKLDGLTIADRRGRRPRPAPRQPAPRAGSAPGQVERQNAGFRGERSMRRGDLRSFLVSLSLTGSLIWGLVYFIDQWWERLPKAVALTVCILLAVMVIGYPIYALARWSDRYLARTRDAKSREERAE
jgi:hypothetical protein